MLLHSKIARFCPQFGYIDTIFFKILFARSDNKKTVVMNIKTMCNFLAKLLRS